jgi:hypothetical protein
VPAREESIAAEDRQNHIIKAGKAPDMRNALYQGEGNMTADGTQLRVALVSPSDREFLVAAVMCGKDQVAEVNVERGNLSVKLYPSSAGGPWRLVLADLLRTLGEAGIRIRDGPAGDGCIPR